MALPVSVIGRHLRAKLFLPCSLQLHNPVGKLAETVLDQGAVQSTPAQVGAHAQRPLTPRGMKSHEVLRVSPIVEQFFRAQRFEQRRNDHCIVTLLEQLTAQILGCVVSPGKRVERCRSGSTRIERFDLLPAQGVTPL